MKQIKQFPFYSINEDGTEIVNNITGKKIIAGEQMINKVSTKYLYVTLCNDGYYWKRIAVHRLVAFTYVDNPNNYNEVNHKDRNRQNNHYTNLEWVTHEQNIRHSFENGREQPKGVDSKLYGRKASKHTKQLQSISKLGIKHPKFKGYYIVHGLKYDSAIQAAKATKEVQRTILRRCKKGEIGSEYYFIPVIKQ